MQICRAERPEIVMSALLPKADIRQRGLDVRYVPKADSCSAANSRAGDDPARLTPSEKTDCGDGSICELFMASGTKKTGPFVW
jgi:hypothetical protein